MGALPIPHAAELPSKISDFMPGAQSPAFEYPDLSLPFPCSPPRNLTRNLDTHVTPLCSGKPVCIKQLNWFSVKKNYLIPL